MIEQMYGSSKRGSVKTRERRKKRRNIFQKDSNPAMKVNSVKNAEMSRVNSRTAMAGHINLKLSEKILLIGYAAMVNLIRVVSHRLL